jgi:SOS response regulatory protein OraA/RecX
MKYLNDKEFALAFANDKVNIKKIGPIALRKEFIPHRLDQELVEIAIENVYKKYPINELIANHLSKKKILSGSELDQKSKKRIIDLLNRKGFNWNDISNVFSELEIKI